MLAECTICGKTYRYSAASAFHLLDGYCSYRCALERVYTNEDARGTQTETDGT